MKISSKTVKKLIVTDVKDLDPLNVFVEEYTPTSGKITMECYGEAWSYFWGSIGEQSIMEFFCSCDHHYLAKKFAPMLDSEVDDPARLIEHIRAHVIKERREMWLYKKEARELYTKALYADIHDPDAMLEIFGDEWWDKLPKQPNYKYEYLTRIIDTAKLAVGSLIEKECKWALKVKDCSFRNDIGMCITLDACPHNSKLDTSKGK